MQNGHLSQCFFSHFLFVCHSNCIINNVDDGICPMRELILKSLARGCSTQNGQFSSCFFSHFFCCLLVFGINPTHPKKKMKKSPIVIPFWHPNKLPKLAQNWGQSPVSTPVLHRKQHSEHPVTLCWSTKTTVLSSAVQPLANIKFLWLCCMFSSHLTVFFVFCGFLLWDHAPRGDLTQPQPLPQLQSLLKPNNKKCHFWSHCYQSQIFFAAVLQTILRMQGSFASLGAMIDIDMECQLDWCPCCFTIQKSIFLWQTMRNKENKKLGIYFTPFCLIPQENWFNCHHLQHWKHDWHWKSTKLIWLNNPLPLQNQLFL